MPLFCSIQAWASRNRRSSPPARKHPRKTAAHRGKPHCRKTTFGSGQTPGAASRMKTLLRTAPPPQASACSPRPVRLGHIHKSASPFNQRQPRNRRSPARDTRVPPGTATGRHGTKPLLLRTSFAPAQASVAHTAARPAPALRRLPMVAAPGGGERDRTDDLLLAKQALSQLSYTPVQGADSASTGIAALCPIPDPDPGLVGQGGFEPPTSRLSSARSNQLSY